jgi:hypothetical protein
MIPARKTWREKCLVREENGTDSDSSQDTLGEAKEHYSESNREDIAQPSGKAFEVNMVFMIPIEFRAPECPVTELNLGAERAVFEKPTTVSEHMKPLYIKGHLDAKPVGRMMVDGGASVNIMLLALLERLGHSERDLKQTNMSLSGFSGEHAEAKGIVSKELTVGSKTMPTSFFVVDVKG